MNIQIKSYEGFAQERKKYDGSSKCFICGCDEPAYYEGGDARFYCGMCAKHALLEENYRGYLINIEKKIRTRMLWDKEDPTLKLLLDDVTKKLLEVK